MRKNVDEIVEVSKDIYTQGLVSGKSGNVSARLGDYIAITPTSKSLGNLKEKDIVLVDFNGNVLTKGKPSSEVNMHLEIYKKRKDVKAIVHTHSPYATGFAFTDKKIKRLEGFGDIKKPFLSCIDYEKPGSDELAKKASEGIGDEDVLILKNHGVLCVGESLAEAKILAGFVEESSKTQFVSLMIKSVEEIV